MESTLDQDMVGEDWWMVREDLLVEREGWREVIDRLRRLNVWTFLLWICVGIALAYVV